MKPHTHIAILGMKHTGKSTVGALLAERLALPFADTDAIVAERSGRTPRELYDAGGPSLMAKAEAEACESLRDRPPTVVATGGGLADNPDALATLRECALLVYLDTPFDILFERVMASARADGRLPRFLDGPDPRGLFQELFTRRSRTYATIADVRIDTGARKPAEIVKDIMDYIEHEQRTDLHS